MGPARARTRRRQLAAIIAVAATVSPVFNVLTSRATVAEAVQGVVDATLVGLLVGVFLLFVRDGAARGWFQRLGFRTDLILISAAVLALFLVGRAAGQVVTSLEPHRFPASFVDPHLRYALPFFAVLAVAVLFVLQMNRMIGANALGYFMAGTYQRPPARSGCFSSWISPAPRSSRSGSAARATSSCCAASWTTSPSRCWRRAATSTSTRATRW